MASVLDFFQVTRQKNTTALLLLLLIALVSATWWLFGLVWALTLCAVNGLSYCATSCLCYRPEASQWREAVSEWYERLFVWGLSYSHLNQTIHGSHTSAYTNESTTAPTITTTTTTTSTNTLKNHTPFPANHAPDPVESRTKGEQTSGANSLNDVRPPHPKAAERTPSDDGGGGGTPQPMRKCHKEAQKLIQLIMKDFVQSWYTNVTNDMEFPEDAQKVLEHVALEINIRLQQVDLEETVVELLELVLPYLEVLNQSGIRHYSGMELFDVNTEMCAKQFEADPRVTHYALKSPAHERRYYRQALDAVIQSAFPNQYAKCDAACMFIREILIKNLFEPLFDLLCDPAFLYEAIPLVLSKATPKKIAEQLSRIETENEELERILNRGRLIVNITGSQGRNKRRFHTSSGTFGQSAYYGKIPSPTLGGVRRSSGAAPSAGRSRPHSIATMCPNMKQTSCGVYEPSSSSWMTQSLRSHPRQHRGSGIEETTTTYPPPTTTTPSSSSSSLRRFGRSRTQNGTGSLYSYQNIVVEGAEYPEEAEADDDDDDDDDDNVDDGDDGDSGEGVEDFDHVVNGEFAMVQLAPIYIERHVRVDPGPGSSNPHIAYIFKVSLFTVNPPIKNTEKANKAIHTT